MAGRWGGGGWGGEGARGRGGRGLGPYHLEPFYQVFARHMRDLGTPVQSRGLFEAIRDALGEDVWFGCVYHGTQAAAAGCGFRWGGEFEMTWASSLREYNAAAPNMLLSWSFMV